MQLNRAAACFLLVTLFFITSANAQDAAKPEASKPDGVIDLKFDDLKFEIDKGAKFERKRLGEKIEKLNGKQVRLTGYILPSSIFQREGIKQFVFVEDNKLCSNLSLPQAPIRVVMEEGVTTKFSQKPITVEGKFEISEWPVTDGRPMAVYHIKATSVKSDAAVEKSARSASEAAKPETVQEITFDDLKFEIAKGAKFDRKMLGEKIEALNGKQVQISGFINPVSVFKQEGIKTLIVTREKMDVNRGAITPIYEAIRVQMEGDATTKFTSKQIVFEGEFEIREWAIINGRPMAVYHIKATSAK